MEKELDCRGLQCPEPVTRCRALLEADAPHTLRALVDNAAALENVSRFLGRNGYAITYSKIDDSVWQINAEKNGTPAQEEAAASGKTLVFLTTETLGRGDEELGRKLMATFLANLSELGDSLWRIILLNGAVKLSCAEGDELVKLKELEAAGVSILVCGTCLNHYGLLEKKQVGETTNMMDIISSLSIAQKIIRP